MADRLADKSAIVTGGGTGIGQAIAFRFAEEGARVALCGRHSQPLDETVAEIGLRGGKATAVVCDVTVPQQVERLVATTLELYGRVDVLVNNAGVRASIGTILDLAEKEFEETMAVDFAGSYHCSKLVIPHMKHQGGGSIIMITSVSAHVGQPRQGVYNAAKAAQELLMKCLALDFAADGIRVNSICPGWVITRLNQEQIARMRSEPDRSFPPGLTYRELLELHPIGRLGRPDDVALAAVYLASSESSWVTGASLFVDGGYTCR